MNFLADLERELADQQRLQAERRPPVYERVGDIVTLLSSGNKPQSISLDMHIAAREQFHSGWVLWLGNHEMAHLTSEQRAAVLNMRFETKAKHLFRLSVWTNSRAAGAEQQNISEIADGAEVFVPRVTGLKLYDNMAQGNASRVEVVTVVADEETDDASIPTDTNDANGADNLPETDAGVPRGDPPGPGSVDENRPPMAGSAAGGESQSDSPGPGSVDENRPPMAGSAAGGESQSIQLSHVGTSASAAAPAASSASGESQDTQPTPTDSAIAIDQQPDAQDTECTDPPSESSGLSPQANVSKVTMPNISPSSTLGREPTVPSGATGVKQPVKDASQMSKMAPKGKKRLQMD